MSPSAYTNGGFERDAEDAPPGFGFSNGHPRGSSTPISEHKYHRGELETRKFVSRKPASRFATIIEANDEYKKILEVMDKLRVFDVDHEFSLPQLVVCGEQSAGKSSVLEAISGIPFPRKGSQCTRFVTQVNMWPTSGPAETETIEVILQKHGATKGQTTFRKTIDKLDELEELVGEASKVMGVGALRDTNGQNREAIAEFSRDILTVNVRAHGQTPLALVDLPGIIQSEGTGTAAAIGTGKRMVDDIVNEWISNENSIILAVVDTTRDPQNHTIFEKAARVDPGGYRTMGIITKPDKLEANQEGQKTWTELALNENGRFKLLRGWHLLRNRNEKELKQNNDNRDLLEIQYFEDKENGWQPIVQESKLSPETCGYGAERLKQRLAILLEQQTRTMLPQIQQQIDDKLKRLDAEIEKIGIAGMEIEEAKKQFAERCEEMSDLATKGIAGHLDKNFSFENLDRNNLDKGAVCYVRGNIREKDEEFATRLREMAHDNFFAWDHSDAAPDTEKWIERVNEVLRKTEGTELQTHTDPARISLFFLSYSEGWRAIAEKHVQEVHSVCEAFLCWVVDKIIKDNTTFAGLKPAIKQQQIRPIMRDRLAQASRELDRLEEDRTRPIRTVNLLFRELSQASRHNETWRIVKQAMDSRDRSALNESLWLKPRYLATSVGLETAVDVRKQQAALFIADMLIYYRIASERFIDEVLIHVNERYLLDNIKKVFSGLSRNEKGSVDKVFRSESQKFEQMQHRRKQLCDEKATLTDLGDALWAAFKTGCISLNNLRCQSGEVMNSKPEHNLALVGVEDAEIVGRAHRPKDKLD